MKRIPVQEQSSKKPVRIAVAVGLGAAAVVAGMHLTQGGPQFEKQKPHSISYLSNDEMETGIQIAYGDTPEQIVQVVNGNRLSGQALIDAETFVEQQGKITEQGSDGTTQYDLYPGQTVEAPIMPDQQIEDVNSGKVG